MKVEVFGWNQGGQVMSVWRKMMTTVDSRGLNLKHVAAHVEMTARDVALSLRAEGVKVRRKKYGNGYAYITFPEAA